MSEKLSSDELKVLTAAILQAKIDGDDQAAEYLASLAEGDPEVVREMFARVRESVPTETKPTGKSFAIPRVPSSPFQKHR